MASVKVFQDNSGLLQTGKVDLVTATALCKIYMSYKTSEPITDQGSECFIKTLGIQKGYFEEANEQVKQLQIYLNQKGFYPENVISGYFGVKTETALKAFQTKNNISPSGIVDDVTFKAICGYESNQSSYCPFVTENLTVGYFENETNEVKMLQMILNKLSLLEEKNITGYFGNLTKEAVKVMQTKSGLGSTGILNLETRQALCKMLNLPLKIENTNPYESADSKVDLTISDVSVLPEKIDVNTKTAIVIKIKNIGSESSASVKGSLYMNDKEITKANISTIASGEEVVGIVKN
jgi:peptidoglycan hydrolase-like protein with peptidoglycan-binding domain